MENDPIRCLQVTPRYRPPETYQGDVAGRVNPYMDDYTHVILVDGDMQVPTEFYELPQRYPDADIIAPKVVPGSLLYRVWEALTYGVRINRVRLRGSAVIYSTKFLKSVGGYPLVESPDTWLYNHAHNVVQAPMRAYHVEKFDLRHSIQTQFRSGKARAEMNQPMWRVAAHSLFRLRPLVLYAYLRYRRRKD